MLKIKIKGINELEFAAKKILEIAGSNKIFAFYGEMGSGKTTFIKALCKAMNVESNVNSPSFSIINEYASLSHGTIFHFDFYRIEKIEEAYDFGFEEYLYSGNYCFIEWPEKIASLLPKDIISIKIIILSKLERELEIN